MKEFPLGKPDPIDSFGFAAVTFTFICMIGFIFFLSKGMSDGNKKEISTKLESVITNAQEAAYQRGLVDGVKLGIKARDSL